MLARDTAKHIADEILGFETGKSLCPIKTTLLGIGALLTACFVPLLMLVILIATAIDISLPTEVSDDFFDSYDVKDSWHRGT